MITEFVITAGEKRKRLDVFLAHREPEVSRSGLQRLIELGRIRVNARVVKPSQKVKPGDHITMDTPQPGPLMVEGEEVALDVLYEDNVLLVVNKPAGIVVHPTSGNWSGTLLNALLAHGQTLEESVPPQKGNLQPGLVHRLDKDTSGVMVVAKTDHAHRRLAVQFERHTITRTYEALVWGIPQHMQGVIELPIGRDSENGRRRSSSAAQPKMAITEYEVVQTFGRLASHMMLSPRTGRTHQLRVHLQSIGCPILGDRTYGGQKVGRLGSLEIPRTMLHARTLGFHHPSSGTFQEYTVRLPSDMEEVLGVLAAMNRL